MCGEDSRGVDVAEERVAEDDVKADEGGRVQGDVLVGVDAGGNVGDLVVARRHLEYERPGEVEWVAVHWEFLAAASSSQ